MINLILFNSLNNMKYIYKTAFFVLLLQSTIQVYANSQEITFDVGYYNYEETVDGDYFMSDESSPAFDLTQTKLVLIFLE